MRAADDYLPVTAELRSGMRETLGRLKADAEA